MFLLTLLCGGLLGYWGTHSVEGTAIGAAAAAVIYGFIKAPWYMAAMIVAFLIGLVYSGSLVGAGLATGVVALVGGVILCGWESEEDARTPWPHSAFPQTPDELEQHTRRR